MTATRQVALAVGLLVAVSTVSAEELRPMRDGVELFVDDVNIARMENLTRRVHPCVKSDGPVLEPDRPWEEDRVYIYGTVHHDPQGGQFRMWYTAGGKVLYATSGDGLKWAKPQLGIEQHEGKDTNIVLSHSNGASVLVDEIEPDASRRYKLLISDGHHNFSGFFSADGIHWQAYPNNPVMPFGSELAMVIRDPATRKYVAYIRPYLPRFFPENEKQKRLGAVTTSEDFENWSPMRIVLRPDEIDDRWVTSSEQRTEFYSMHGFPYGRSYLGVIPLFRITQIHETIGKGQSKYDGPMWGELITSRDGLSWQRMDDRTPIIPAGKDYDQSIMNVATLPIIVGDEVWLYYTGINTTHGGPMPPKRITIGLAKWPLDRFVSLGAGDSPGIVETRAISDRSGELVVNADMRGGSLVVEVLDSAGKVMSGYTADQCVTIESDDLRHVVRWKEHAELPKGQPLRLRFRLTNGSLFSYTIGGGGEAR